MIDDRIAASLVSRFSQAYANGDMERLMQLFTHDAQNGHGDRHAIAEDYRRLFEASESRRIAVSDMSWLTVGNGATIIASFETEVVPRGKTHGEHAAGDIRFDLREEDGELRIYRLSHDNRRS
jgi:ketosteroid isomerase-like protein